MTLVVSVTTAAVIYMAVMREPACSVETGADESIIKADVRISQNGNDVSTYECGMFCTSLR